MTRFLNYGVHMRMRILKPWILLAVFWPVALKSQHPDLQKSDVYIVPFSHLDLYWACTQEECLSRGNYIISRAIELSRLHPDSRFVLESEVFVNDFVETHRGTAELKEFYQLVKEGRIEVAPIWAGIYQNQPRGEALVRNLVYGKQYARENFGVDPEVAHMTDIPGFTRQYPQILSKSATPYMVMTRMGPRDLSLFHWKAPDGSSVLVWNTINGYGWGAGVGLHLDLDKDRLANIARDIKAVQSTTGGPVYLGFGTDLWAPAEKLRDNIGVLNERLAPDRFRIATAEEFFRAAAKTPGIPNVSGEIPSSWANLTTSLVPLWPPAMSATDTILNAEKFAAINYALGYAPYPEQKFEYLWKDALKSLDHNNDGQGGDIGDERKLGYAQEASLGAGQILRDSLRNIAERVQSPFARSTSIVVFNPLSWTRDDIVKSHVTLFGAVETENIDDYKKALRIVDEKGISIPFQIELYSDGSSRSIELVFIARGVPSLGYKAYYIVPADKRDEFPNACDIQLETDTVAKQSNSALGSDLLENRYYRVAVSRATGRVDIFDKELKQNVVKNVEVTAAEERGGDDQNIILRSGRTIFNLINSVELEENGPVRTVLRISGTIGSTPIVQRLALYRELKKIDFENSISWAPGSSMNIEQVFPIEQPNFEVQNGIPFGTVSSRDMMPKAGPHWEDEVSPEIWKGWRQIQDWMFAGTKQWGFTVSADHQLIDLSAGALRAQMLRGTRFSPVTTSLPNGQPILDARPSSGIYVFRYSLTSGEGDWVKGRSWRAGMSFSSPLIAVTSVNPNSEKPLPPQQSFLELSADNLVISALKKTDGDGTVLLRVFEIQGDRAETTLRFLGQHRDFRAANMLEEDLSVTEQRTLSVAPYEISTVKLRIN